jgi:hypothetical protein
MNSMATFEMVRYRQNELAKAARPRRERARRSVRRPDAARHAIAGTLMGFGRWLDRSPRTSEVC